MKTLGIDIASDAKHTATCVIDWTNGRATLTELRDRCNDDYLYDAINREDVVRVAIDAPFGWPVQFVRAMQAHHDLAQWPNPVKYELTKSKNLWEPFRLRTTDEWVFRATGVMPLSVSADRLAVAAFRCASILSTLGPRVDRSGETGRFVEVYPAVALKQWGCDWMNYKGVKNFDGRRAVLDALLPKVPWLDLDGFRPELEKRDHALDAFVASLNAQAAVRGLTEALPPEHLEIARHEGWIRVPCAGSLEQLAHA